MRERKRKKKRKENQGMGGIYHSRKKQTISKQESLLHPCLTNYFEFFESKKQVTAALQDVSFRSNGICPSTVLGSFLCTKDILQVILGRLFIPAD